MSETEYKELLYQASVVSDQLTEMLNEAGQELFEKYCEMYEKIILYKATHQA